MPKKYPSLNPQEVINCLIALGFEEIKHKKGDHRYFEKNGHILQVDTGKTVKNGFATPGMKIIISNTGYSREIFYRATAKTAKKIDEKPLSKSELDRL